MQLPKGRILLLIILLAALAACDTTLETGYKPKLLGGTNDADRRAYYAPAFTPEAHGDKKSGPAFEPG